jgi:hypothetical protein
MGIHSTREEPHVVSEYRQTIGSEQFPDSAAFRQDQGWADDGLEEFVLALPVDHPWRASALRDVARARTPKTDGRKAEHSSLSKVERAERGRKGGKARAANARQREIDKIRQARRDRTEGIDIAAGHRTYKRNPEKWQAHWKALPELLRAAGIRHRFSYEADFLWDYDECRPDHLFRHGFAKPLRRQRFAEWAGERTPMKEREQFRATTTTKKGR